MKVLYAKEVRKLDQEAVQMGISTKTLMNHAAQALANHIRQVDLKSHRIAILCGPGNNGGDGFALALHLQKDPIYHVELFCICEEAGMSEDEAYYAKRCMEEQIMVHREFPISLQGFDLVVDCLFGTGLQRAITGAYATLIECINQSDAYVLACDIPSGLLADSGCCMNPCVLADATVTFAAGKLGLYMGDGAKHSGLVEIADIGIPETLVEAKDGYDVLTPALVKELLPKRRRNSHKGSYGKVLLIGGSYGMSGAVIMAAKAALRCGVGTCTIMADEKSLPIIAASIPEVMYLPYPNDKQQLQDVIAQYDAIAIGNGLGRDGIAKWLVDSVWNSDLPCVFDGDALYLLGKIHKTLRSAKTVLTPHPKEVSYLIGIETQEIMKCPAESFYRLLEMVPEATIVWKEAKTLISDRESQYINVDGNNGLATGGSGDVLCGMILGLLAQGVQSVDASACGVAIHAWCADALLAYESTYSILPTDLLQILPSVLKKIIDMPE